MPQATQDRVKYAVDALNMAQKLVDRAKAVLVVGPATRHRRGHQAFDEAFSAGEQYSIGELGELTCDTHQAAEILGYSEEHVRRLLREHKLVGIAHGGRTGWRLSREYVLQQAEVRRISAEHRAATASA